MMFLGFVLCIIFGFVFWNLWSYILLLHENIEKINRTSLSFGLMCSKCKKNFCWKMFFPINVFFKKNECAACKKWAVISLFLVVVTAIMFCIIYYCFYWSNVWTMIFRMLSSRILLIISICDILWYEICLSLIIVWWIFALLTMYLWLFDWSCLWWAVVFLCIFLFIYYAAFFYTKMKYKIEEEGIWMGDLIISPYLWVLLYMWILTPYIEELFCSVLLFFIFTGIFWLIIYLIQNIIVGKKAEFLSWEMAERALPLVPSMSISLLVVIACHDKLFNFLVGIGDSFFNHLMTPL